jgi:hypothetical protein
MQAKYELDSPFLEEELFSDEAAGWNERAAAVAAESPFYDAVDPGKRAGTEALTELEAAPGWKKTNLQLEVRNYRGEPLQYYWVDPHIVDVRTGKTALIGDSRRGVSMERDYGTTDSGIVTYPDALVPLQGTLHVLCGPVLDAEQDLKPMGEFVGGELKGTTKWVRNGRDMVLRVTQDSKKVVRRSKTREELESRLRAEGTIGFVVGPVEAGGSAGSESGQTQAREEEIEFEVKIAQNRLRIEIATISKSQEEVSSEYESFVEAWPDREDDDPVGDEEAGWAEADVLEAESEKPATFADAFSLKAPVASCIQTNAPAHPAFRSCKYHFQILALNRKTIWGQSSSELWFLLTFDYNGVDVKDAQIVGLAEKSSPIHLSGAEFSIEFSNACADPASRMAEVRFKIAGRWKSWPHEDEVSFWGGLFVRADGSARLQIESENGAVQHGKFTGACPPMKPPAPKEPKPVWTIVYFDSGSWALGDKAERAKLGAWWNGLPATVRDRIAAGQIPINLHGYASTKGKTRSNRILSKKRAEEVREILMGEAGSSAVYRIFPHGEDRADTPDQVESHKERRVSISVYF